MNGDLYLAGALSSLLGCDWGRRIALPGDQDPCGEQAVQRVVLHGHPDDGDFDVKLCQPHADIVIAETDPHRTEVRP